MAARNCRRALLVAVLVMFGGDIAAAAVVVFDRATLEGRPVQLAVLTKGRFFAEGGQLVDLYAGSKLLKRILTGADGYGYLTYTPAKAGMLEISADFAGERDTGRLLVMGKEEQAVLIDVETALRTSVLSTGVRRGSSEAIRELSKRYRVIYIYGLAGLRLTRHWLALNELPEAVLLPGRNTKPAAMLARQGISVHAFIGSAAQTSAAKNEVEKRFSFEETKDGRKVDSWREVLEGLGIENSTDAK